MDRNNAAILATAIFGAAVTIFTIVSFDWMSWACRVPIGSSSKPIADGFGACFDFWLQRYQSLVAVFITATVAGIGILVGYKQLQIARNNFKGVAVANAYEQFEKACERHKFLQRAQVFIIECGRFLITCKILRDACEGEYTHIPRIIHRANQVVDECKTLRSLSEEFDDEITEIEFRRHMGLILAYIQLFESSARRLIDEPERVIEGDQLKGVRRDLMNMRNDLDRIFSDFKNWYHDESVIRSRMIHFWNREYGVARRSLPTSIGINSEN